MSVYSVKIELVEVTLHTFALYIQNDKPPGHLTSFYPAHMTREFWKFIPFARNF